MAENDIVAVRSGETGAEGFPGLAATITQALFLVKGARKAVREGLEEKGEHRSAAGDNRSLDRHAGVELDIRHAGELVGANFDRCQEIGEACAFLGHRISGNSRHFALDHGSRPLLIGHETNRGRQIWSHHIDIDRLNFHLEHEFVAAGNEVEHGAAGRDNTPRGVRAKIYDHTILWRGHHVALSLGPRLYLLLAQGRQPIFVRFNVALHFEHGSLKLKDLRLLCITLLVKASLIRELFLETLEVAP